MKKLIIHTQQKSSESNLSISNKTLLPILDLIPGSTNHFTQDNTLNDSFNLVLNNHGLTTAGYQKIL
nr:hypothetical protein [Entomoplasma sp. MP1]